MKNIHKILLSLLFAASLFFSAGTALADPPGAQPGAPGGNPTPSASAASPTTCTDPQTCLKQSPIVADINQIVNFLSAGVAVVVVLSIVIGGIQYIMAGDKPEAVTAAKERITNSLIALVAFILVFSFLQWLIPGGIFG